MEEQLKEILSCILRSREQVLVCLPESAAQAHFWKNAVILLGCTPEFLESRARWCALLRRAFDGRHTVAIGSPRILLGLGKLSRYTGIPLCIRNAILTEACPTWICAAIEQSLDCKIWPLPPREGTIPHGKLWEQENAILRWSSVLDVRLICGTYGLELEAVVFPGKKLPAFPNCARQRIRVWEAEKDVPFSILYDWKNWKNH